MNRIMLDICYNNHAMLVYYQGVRGNYRMLIIVVCRSCFVL